MDAGAVAPVIVICTQLYSLLQRFLPAGLAASVFTDASNRRVASSRVVECPNKSLGLNQLRAQFDISQRGG